MLSGITTKLIVLLTITGVLLGIRTLLYFNRSKVDEGFKKEISFYLNNFVAAILVVLICM